MGYLILLLLVSLISACSAVSVSLPAESDTLDRMWAEQRIFEARNAVAKARHLRGLWRDTEAHLSNAEIALTEGEYQLAVNHAELTIKEAHLATNQTYLERSKFRLQQLELSAPETSSTQRGLIATIRREIRLKKGQSAYRHLMDLLNTITE